MQTEPDWQADRAEKKKKMSRRNRLETQPRPSRRLSRFLSLGPTGTGRATRKPFVAQSTTVRWGFAKLKQLYGKMKHKASTKAGRSILHLAGLL
jgi:hypothetical protein